MYILNAARVGLYPSCSVTMALLLYVRMYLPQTVIKKEPLDASEYSDGEAGRFSQAYHERRYHHRRTQQSPRFTFPTGNSMDVLLEVAEQARQKEEEERQKRVVADVLAHGVGSTPRKRPENISIPEYDHSGKRLKSMSPPPVMSPRPSILNMLSPRSSQPSTPGILKTRQSKLSCFWWWCVYMCMSCLMIIFLFG